MTTKYDVVIIGGGVAGALTAHRLLRSKEKLSILILEAGDDRIKQRLEMSLAYATAPVKSPGSPYKNSKSSIPFPDITKPETSDYYKYEPNSTEFKSTYVKIGGGSTWHFLGNVPRFVPRDFKLLENYKVGRNWPIDYADLADFYNDAECELGVSGNTQEWQSLYGDKFEKFPMPEIWPTYSDKLIRPKLDTLDIDNNKVQVRSTPQARNSQIYQGRPACAGNSSCVPICPIGAKYDATVHLEQIKEHVHIRYKAVVHRLEQDETKRIKYVHYKNWEGQEHSVEGRVVIVACHAIESALLLLNSNVANSSTLVGKNLMDHPQGYGVGLSNEPVYPFRGPPTTSGIDVFRDGASRNERAAFRISLGNDGWGRWKGKDKLEAIVESLVDGGDIVIGKDLVKKIQDQGTRIFRFSYSTEMLPDVNNYVKQHPTEKDPRTGLPLPLINFKIDRNTSANQAEHNYNQKAFTYASSVLVKFFNAIGATEVQTISSISEFSGAGHIMGTTRMGDDAATAVVDKNCKTFDNTNLFLIGPGVFPTSGTANPTITVAALALRLADHLAGLFENKSIPQL